MIFLKNKLFLTHIIFIISLSIIKAQDVITFSKESGFYPEEFDLTLSVSGNSKIFYTVDSSNPTNSSTTTKPAQTQSTSIVKPIKFEQNEVVNFKGNKHYRGANAKTALKCKSGLARITLIAPGGLHPYHLIKEPGKGSTVFGWVDAKDIEKA